MPKIKEKTKKSVVPLIDLNEFMEFGYLQEVNRLFFHPLGMALMFGVNDETGKVDGISILDGREDPQGYLFDEEYIGLEKVEKVGKELAKRSKIRQKKFGFIIQPASNSKTP